MTDFCVSQKCQQADILMVALPSKLSLDTDLALAFVHPSHGCILLGSLIYNNLYAAPIAASLKCLLYCILCWSPL